VTDDYLRAAIRDLVCLRFGLDPTQALPEVHMPELTYAALSPENQATVRGLVRTLYRAQCATKGAT
jgi:hypothetical protein